MSSLWVKYDTATGKITATSVAPGSFIAQEYDVGVGGQTNFVVTATFDAGTKIEVLLNGVKMREGATYDWVRNVTLNRIEFNYTVLQNGWVEIKTYP